MTRNEATNYLAHVVTRREQDNDHAICVAAQFKPSEMIIGCNRPDEHTPFTNSRLFKLAVKASKMPFQILVRSPPTEILGTWLSAWLQPNIAACAQLVTDCQLTVPFITRLHTNRK
jgi:hypothetical protein